MPPSGMRIVLRTADQLHEVLPALLEGVSVIFEGDQSGSLVQLRVSRPSSSSSGTSDFHPFCWLDVFLDLSQEPQSEQDEAIHDCGLGVTLERWLCRFDMEKKN